MKWKRGQRSDHVRDERRSGGAGGLGSLGGLPIGLGGGIGGIVLLVAIVVLGGSLLGGGSGSGTGIDLRDILGRLGGTEAPAGAPLDGAPDPDAELVEFMNFLADDIQAAWQESFAAGGRTYEATDVVLFSEVTQSGCGQASSAVGPFYCPADSTVYLDLGFFEELAVRFGAPGDFAQAYVVAHEVGHHVQNLLGISDEVNRAQQGDPDEANELSVRLELQADCFAGVWAHTTYERGLLEEGDTAEALDAAASVGDDRIQKEATGSIDPESFTHGTSEQRARWFRRGFDSGASDECDTFSAEDL